MTLDEVNALSEDAFIAAFGGVYEHSPWVAEEVVGHRPYGSAEDLRTAMKAAVSAALETQKLALLRAHPDLAGKAAIDGTLTEASQTEQASAGLDRLHQHEFDEITDLNKAYTDRFGFPFIICVRLTNKAGIFDAIRARVTHDSAQEFETALNEVHRIAALRLETLIE